MTSHRTKSLKMQATTKEKKRDLTSSCKEKPHTRPNDKPALPLLKKSVYMDVKQGKQAKTLEEQLRKLGATVEKFLSCEVNYVISSFCPINMRQEERPSTGEDNPQSPSFVPSPFSCGPSPTGTSSDPKKNLVSRGKALAQIACAKNQTASTVISRAEKLGIKVVSVEVANKWLDKELKKIEGCKDKKENTQERIKNPATKKRRKVLKGAYIKFEACNRMYRPIKSELDRWPKLNPSAPPGLNPFTEVKMKMTHNVVNVRRQLLMRNKRTAYGGALSSKVRMKRSCSKLSAKNSGMAKQVHIVPDLVGVPITTAGDVKRNMENHWKKRPDKLQGYCECCEEKYKDLNQHLNEERHRVYARTKSNYESLDVLISEISPPADFLQNLLLHHCSQKQTETFPKSDDKRLKDALPDLCVNVASPISSIKTGNVSQDDIEALDMCTPQLDQEGSSDARLNSEAASKEGEEKSDKRPQAVVIRRPTASGIFTSPRRRQPTPSKKPWVQERCMVFRDSPMASLQPTNAISQIHFKVNENILMNPYHESVFTKGDSTPTRLGENLCEGKHSTNFKNEVSAPSLHRTKPSPKPADLKVSEKSVPVLASNATNHQSKSNLADGSTEPEMSEHKPLPVDVVNGAVCPSGQEALHNDSEGKSEAVENLREIEKILKEEDISVPGIADRVKTRTRKNGSGEKLEETGQQSPLTKTLCSTSQEKNEAVSDRIKDSPCNRFDTISSGKSRQEELSIQYEMGKCSFDSLTEEKCSKAHIHSKKGNDNKLCDTSDRSRVTSKDSGSGDRLQVSKTPSKEGREGSPVQVSPKQSGDYLCKNQVESMDKMDSEGVDSDGKGHAARQQKSKRKKIHQNVRRALCVDFQKQTAQQHESVDKLNCLGEGIKEDLNVATVRSRSCKNGNSAVTEKTDCCVTEDKPPKTTDKESEGVDSDSKCHAVRQQKSKRNKIHKSINRVLSVDLQNQTAQQLESPDKSNSLGEALKEDLNTTAVRNRRCKNDNGAVTEKLDRCMTEEKPHKSTEKERRHLDNKECLPSSSCVADSLKENVRKCRQFVHEGMYNENTIGLSNDVGRNYLSRSSKQVDCPGTKNVRQEAESFDDADAEDSNVDDGQDRQAKATKRLSRKKAKRKSYEKKMRKSVDWNQKERCDDQNPVTKRAVSPSDVIVPNIAERVKSRRSCTHFNHEGQYANGGEGVEENTPKFIKTVNKHRRLLKARKRLWNNINKRRVGISDDSQITIPSSEQNEEGKIKSKRKFPTHQKRKSATHNAVVIRRGRSSFNSLSKRDANWSKRISDKDWSQCETETDDLGNEKSKVLSQECQSQASSTTEEHKDQIKLSEDNAEEKGAIKETRNRRSLPLRNAVQTTAGEHKDQIKLCGDSAEISQPVSNTSNRSTSEEKDTISEMRKRRRSLSLRKAVQTLQLKQLRKSQSQSQICVPSNMASSRSPRLRLKIQRNPIDESYSSTLEEIYEDMPNIIDSPCPCQSPDLSVEVDEKSASPTNRDPVRIDGGQRTSLPATSPRQKMPSLIHKDHPASVCDKDLLTGQGNKIVHLICDDLQKDSTSGISNKDENSGIKSESRRLKRESRDGSLDGKIREDKQGGQEFQTDDSRYIGVGNSSQKDNISKDYVQTRKKVTHKDLKSQRQAKHHSKRKQVSREDSMELEDSLRPSKKIKLSGNVSNDACDYSKEDDVDRGHETNEAFNSVNVNLITKTDSSHNPEPGTSEVDFSKLHSEERSKNKSQAKIRLLWKESGSSAQTAHKSQESLVVNESCGEEPPSGFQEDNTQASLNTNLGDILAFVPTFSSPGKTNSSWDDACDSYLNTSAKSDFHSANQFTPSTAMLSPTHMSPNPFQAMSSFVGSPGHKSPRKTAKGYFSPDVLGQFTSPTKRKPLGTGHLEGSPVIEKVDSVISFNHMSPQKLNFSPKKCEKSVCHRRNFNSPSKKSPLKNS